jgi:hypothetical protein
MFSHCTESIGVYGMHNEEVNKSVFVCSFPGQKRHAPRPEFLHMALARFPQPLLKLHVKGPLTWKRHHYRCCQALTTRQCYAYHHCDSSINVITLPFSSAAEGAMPAYNGEIMPCVTSLRKIVHNNVRHCRVRIDATRMQGDVHDTFVADAARKLYYDEDIALRHDTSPVKMCFRSARI